MLWTMASEWAWHSAKIARRRSFPIMPEMLTTVSWQAKELAI